MPPCCIFIRPLTPLPWVGYFIYLPYHTSPQHDSNCRRGRVDLHTQEGSGGRNSAEAEALVQAAQTIFGLGGAPLLHLGVKFLFCVYFRVRVVDVKFIVPVVWWGGLVDVRERCAGHVVCFICCLLFPLPCACSRECWVLLLYFTSMLSKAVDVTRHKTHLSMRRSDRWHVQWCTAFLLVRLQFNADASEINPKNPKTLKPLKICTTEARARLGVTSCPYVARSAVHSIPACETPVFKYVRARPGVTSCPYVPVVFLAPFLRPLMQVLAHFLPDRSLREVRDCFQACLYASPLHNLALLAHCLPTALCATNPTAPCASGVLAPFTP